MIGWSGSRSGRWERRELAENDALRLPRRRGAVVVRVERGTVLVTRRGDLEDHVLEAGDELVLPRAGLAVAWAFTDAVISWREGLPAPAARAGVTGSALAGSAASGR